MALAIDMVGTRLGSGTRTYNLSFCEYINTHNIDQTIFIFITKDYLKNIKINQNPNIKYLIKSNIFTNIFFRICWMQFILPFELKLRGVGQLYSPMNMSPLILRIFNIELTLALHSNLPWVYFDMMPGNYLRNFLTKFFMQLSIFVCDKLIVDSEFAKNEIVNILKLNQKKVFVVYLGIDKKYLSLNKNENFIKGFEYKNYIISVLSCVKYHNIINLLKGFKLLKKEKDLNFKFVIVLQILDKKYYSEIKNFISNNFDENEIIFFHNLDSNYLVNLYRGASFYIFSSYCEVFGLTSLEAMTQGCPVLISKKSALLEINGEAAEYFDPDNEIEIKECMKKVLFNNDIKKNLVERGTKRYKIFNWDNTVKETLKIIKQ